MMSDVEMIRATSAYKRLLDSGVKHIMEKEYDTLVSSSVVEAFADRPSGNTGFNAAMGWWNNKRKAIKQALQSDGIVIHFADEYERQFKEWYDNQDLPVINGPLHALKVYSEKRKEFDALYKKNNEWIVSENI